jgi:hypothetical protein
MNLPHQALRTSNTPRSQTPKIPIRCNKAQMTIIPGNYFLNRINNLQDASPNPSRSPQIVPRGTIWKVAGKGTQNSSTATR